MKEKFVFWKYENVKKIYDQANATKKRAKLLLRHYIYQHSDTNIQQNIVPLLCETFMNTHNFMKYLHRRLKSEYYWSPAKLNSANGNKHFQKNVFIGHIKIIIFYVSCQFSVK